MIGFTIAVGIAALNTGNNLLYLILSMMLSAIAVSGISSESIVGKIQVERRLPDHAVAGESFNIYYLVTNTRRRGDAYALSISEPDVITSPATTPMLKSKESQLVSAEAALETRGVKELVEIRISSRFPFGLFTRSKIVKSPEEILVYPETFDLEAPDESSGERGQTRESQRKGEGSDLIGLKEYVWGDNPRRIHWRTSARAAKLMLKETADEDTKRITILLDVSGFKSESMRDGLEEAISLAASWAEYHTAGNRVLRLITNDARTPFGQGPAHLDVIMRHLALFDPTPGKIDTRNFEYISETEPISHLAV